MDKAKPIGFSNEIIEFSKLVQETFSNVSKDVKLITATNDKNTKLTNADINKIKKEIVELKSIINSFKTSIVEIDKKVKRRNSIVTESAKPTNKKDEIKFLMSEIADIKLSIKNIERKLKMD
jgi:hypothetical protein